jgi:tRNA-guanine family transglycosylase
MAGEILAARALTEHNLHFYSRLIGEARAAISSGTYESFARAVMAAESEWEDAPDGAKNDVA